MLGALADYVASRGARAIFIPTNNGMPPEKVGAELVADARASDIVSARQHGVAIIRADVAGRAGQLASHGSSVIVDSDGRVLSASCLLQADLLVGEIPS